MRLKIVVDIFHTLCMFNKYEDKENNTIYNSDSVGAYNIMRIYRKEKGIDIAMPIKGLSNPEVINVYV